MNYSVQLDPITQAEIQIKLYRNVKNVPEVREKIISGALKCCVVKPSLILDPFQIVVAANKALTSEKLKTRTVYSEILFNLSVSKNITHSLQLFGIDDKETDLLVAVVSKNGEDDSESAFDSIRGDEVAINVLSELVNRSAVKKAYKISDVEFKECRLLDSVVSRIAVKDCIL